MVNTICVAGGGTMGSGIALVAARSGFNTLLFDISKGALDESLRIIQLNIRHLVDKGKMPAAEGSLVLNRIRFLSEPAQCIADLFIEAIIENTTAKISLFNSLATLNDSAVIFASNTSSLSISSIQSEVPHPERVCGMHFFNPAPVMKLVEVVKGKQTSESTVQTIDKVCKSMGKIAVHCNDSPGFIVNRVARHYYLETMRLVESGNITIEDADRLLESAGFKMGPFKLMDLIGLDINLAVSSGLYNAFGQHKRFAPSALQQAKVDKGELGKKTGTGFYSYES